MNQQGNNLEPAKQGIPVMLVAQPIEESAINLFDLLHGLARRKFLIVGVAVFTTMMGVLYAFLASPVYQAETTLIQPSMHDIRRLILIDDSYTPEKTFEYFAKELNSRTIRNDYFLNSGVASKLYPGAKSEQQLRDAFRSFDRSLQWKDGTLTMTGPEPKLTADLLNGLVQYGEQKIKTSVSADLKSAVGIKIERLQQKMDDLIAKDKSHRETRIERIREALSIARKLGINDYRLSITAIPTGSTNKENNSVTATDIPLYMRGTKSLQAELDSLLEKNNRTQSVPGLLQLKEQVKQLQQLASFGNDDFNMAIVSEAAIAPDHPIKPKRKAIIVASFLLGIFAGIFAAFLANRISPGQRKEWAETA